MQGSSIGKGQKNSAKCFEQVPSLKVCRVSIAEALQFSNKRYLKKVSLRFLQTLWNPISHKDPSGRLSLSQAEMTTF
jgi:hypothetical protein